jgi:hypothetical protein
VVPFFAAVYNLIAIPTAAGALYPSLGMMVRPEFGADVIQHHRRLDCPAGAA